MMRNSMLCSIVPNAHEAGPSSLHSIFNSAYCTGVERSIFEIPNFIRLKQKAFSHLDTLLLDFKCIVALLSHSGRYRCES